MPLPIADKSPVTHPSPVPRHSTTGGGAPQGLRWFDPAAEAAIIGALMSDPEVIHELGGELSPGYFSGVHRTIYDAICRLHGRGQPVSPVTVTMALREAGLLDEVGGAYAISGYSYIPSRVIARHCIERAREFWQRREARAVAETLMQALESGDDLAAIEEARCQFERLRYDDRRPLASIMEIAAGPHDPHKNVLADRFLCVGGAMLFVGPSGIGKSSASMQQDLLWSLGREAFGIKPARPLKILTIQAENDSEDLAEMRDGVIKGLDLSTREREIIRQSVYYETECARVGADFLRLVDSRLSLGQFDLLRIDPLQAYLGGDPKETEVTAQFLRAGLTPLLNRHRVACVLNHHTPKTNHRDTSEWRANDWMYAGAGSADITNWARAALVIDSTHAAHVFKFIAAKRGARIGWSSESGDKETIRYFCHAAEGIHWREATPADLDDVENAARAKKAKTPPKTPGDLKALLPMKGTVTKNTLIVQAQEVGIGCNKARTFLNHLVEKGEIFEWRTPRSRTNSETLFSREPQTLFDDAK